MSTSDTLSTTPTLLNEHSMPKARDTFPDLIPGYPKLSGRMGVMPEIAMFRRFGALNARNLLYLQNQLSFLEVRLKACEYQDSQNGEGKKSIYAVDHIWMHLSDKHEDGRLRDGDTRQKELVVEMRELLKEYSI
jgi:hypothetical protein